MSDERDDFWDIGKLVPKKKAKISPFVSKPVVKEVTLAGDVEKSEENRKIPSEASENGNDGKSTYTYLRDDSLVKRVTVTKFVDKYDFYGSFRKAALLYYDMKAPKCDFEPFFSYMPQYSQLTSAQRSYYLFWREELRHSRYIKSDYSYIYLYAYEILNLPDKIPPKDGIKKLIEVWREYRREYPNINAHFSLWVQDYCLLYNLPTPIEEMSDFLFEAISASTFKEFYLSRLEFLNRESTEALVMYLSYYDWHRGKYAGGESRTVYKKHLLGAMYLFFRELWRRGSFKPDSSTTATISRPSFRNSLCTHSVKSMLEIEYYPIIHDEKLRNTVTEALRYTENQLRALLGVKSRLAVKELSDDYKRVIDFYFSTLFEKLKREKKAAERPEYEKLYESESLDISADSADKIEKLSWTNTEKLVVEDDVEIKKEEAPFPAAVQDSKLPLTNYGSEESYGLSSSDVAFLSAALDGDFATLKDICERTQELAEGILDRINSAFADNFGDIVLELRDDIPKIIEDYREDITEWIMKQTK